MDIMSVWLYVLVLSLQFVGGWNSPCPGIFDYEFDGDDIYGIITVKPKDDQLPVSVLEMRLNMTVAYTTADLIKFYSEHSKLEQLEDEHEEGIEPFSSENLRMYNEGQAVKYRLHIYDTTKTVEPMPKVVAISVNGDIICFGPIDIPGPTNVIVVLVSFHYKSLLNSGTLGSTYESEEHEAPVIITSVYYRNIILTAPPIYWHSDSAGTKKLQANNGVQRQRDFVKPIKRNQEPIKWNQEPIKTDECGMVAGGNERVPLINKGHIYGRGEIPWLVAIYGVDGNNLQFKCGGTLVSDRHVVTAAHCMQLRGILTPMTEIVVKIGVHSLNDSDDLTVTRQLIAATIHKEYNSYTLKNDVMILTLNRRVKFNRFIRPACLWSGNTELIRVVGANGVVAGWGRGVVSIRGKQDEPRMVNVRIVSTKDCRASNSYFHRLTSNTTLCAGDRNGAGPCTGDSGGGLYILDGGKWKLRGIVSISLLNEAHTCDLGEYVVFTDTAQFLPWIRNILSEKYYG